MDIFECSRCCYSTPLKQNMKAHLKRKNPCIPKEKNVLSPEELLKELYPIKDTKHVCKCGKSYSYYSGLYVHQKKCTIHIKEVQFFSIVEKLEKEIEKLKEGSSTTVTNSNNNNSNNNSNNTMNNTIVVNNFGYEDISHLSPQFIEKCLCYMSMGFKGLTQAIHLDKNKPENHTIKVTNIKSPYVSVIKDGKWVYKDKDEALSDLIWKENQILKSHYEENEVDMKRRWTAHKLEVVKGWLDRLEDEDNELWTRLKKEIFLILINNRDVLMEKMTT